MHTRKSTTESNRALAWKGKIKLSKNNYRLNINSNNASCHAIQFNLTNVLAPRTQISTPTIWEFSLTTGFVFFKTSGIPELVKMLGTQGGCPPMSMVWFSGVRASGSRSPYWRAGQNTGFSSDGPWIQFAPISMILSPAEEKKITTDLGCCSLSLLYSPYIVIKAE